MKRSIQLTSSCYATLLIITVILAGCGEGQAGVKFTQGAASATPGQKMQWTFDKDVAGAIPAGATSFSGKWEVRAEADAPSTPNALCQTGSAEFPALSLSDTVYRDVDVSAQVKPISGQSDQAAGIIFRVQDKDNYYILRANALEGNVNLYKYAGGVRNGLKDGSAEVKAGQWQELRVEVKGNQLRGFLGGKLIVEATDDTYQAGKVGLWTKSDSVTCFDDVEATSR